MKNLFILLICLMPFPSLAQQKNHEINGISIFEIGKTKQQILHQLDSMGYGKPQKENAYKLNRIYAYNNNYEDARSTDEMISKMTEDISKESSEIKPTAIYQAILSDTSLSEKYNDAELYNDRYLFTPNCQRYFISEFKINDEIKLKSLDLYFLNDTLLYFKCDYSTKIESGLTLKYGEPNIVEEEKYIECTNTFTGTKNKYREFSDEKTWLNNNGTFVKLYYMVFYSNSCKIQYVSFVSCGNNLSNNINSKVYDSWKKRKKLEFNNQKKNTLDKL